MDGLKLFLKQRLIILTRNWPLDVSILIIVLANPLQQHISVPTWLTISAAILIMIGWCIFYWHKGAEDRRKVAEDKKAFAEKVAAAEAQLFGTRRH
ncbi:MAG: hypothetical protein ABI210_14800 [Abditibacteriaceae bacterium]